ncbi:acetyl-/propionyl-coenzyme A carboxylase alpha chain, AccA2 [Mycobacteroides abscessus subsp. abscessus]|nr:acetyl-/propionyl-coenzyme A carboxylase alpha chain, AccA2 [Mycobacteroides abscessus subsp. abscessus]
MARALRETRVHGVTTNRDLLVAVLCEPEFRAGAIDTGYLQRHDPSALLASGEVAAQTHAVVAAIAAQAQRRQLTPILPGLPSGWRTLPSNDQIVEYEIGADIVQVRYRFGRDNVHVAVGDWQPDVRILSAVANLVDAEIDGVRRRYRVAVNGSVHYVDSALGSSALREVPRFPDPSSIQEPGSLLAPMPGVVVRVEVTEGDAVNAGTVIMVLEAMKMEHTVRSPAEGVVTSISVKSSEQVDAGQVLAVVGENSGDAS